MVVGKCDFCKTQRADMKVLDRKNKRKINLCIECCQKWLLKNDYKR